MTIGASQEAKGSLTLVGTPIGNRADLSSRGLDALRQADTVLAEDTRVSGKLLSSLGVEARLERCDENVIAEKSAGLVRRMMAGERMAFVSDGFLPRKDGERARVLKALAGLPAVLVFYESPHRVADSLGAIAGVFPRRRVALARELTKMFQEVVRASATEMVELMAERGEPKGECVLLVDAPDAEELAAWERKMAALELGAAGAGEGEDEEFDLDRAIRAGLAAGKRATALAKELARCCDTPRPEIYERICELGKEG